MKIHTGQIGVRFPYYIKCSLCGDIIEGWNVEEIVSLANERGWNYDYDSDSICCSYCREENDMKGGSI